MGEPAAVDGTQPAIDHRRRPRRRGHALDRAILAATLAEIEESGYADLRMERVAARARASKASLYRRWPSKVELVLSAVYELMPNAETVPNTGSLRADVLALLGTAGRVLCGPSGRAVRGLVSETLRDPDLRAQLRLYTRGYGLQAMQQIVARADVRGELDAGPITVRQLEVGPTLLRAYLLTHEGPVPDEEVVGIVDEVVLPLLRHAAPGLG
jgi:AcrR family transcriptional regulator